MKTFAPLIAALALLFMIVLACNLQDRYHQNSIRDQHNLYLEASPFKANRFLNKKERIVAALPPSGYMEEEWELTMNPFLGRPTPEKLKQVQNNVNLRSHFRAPGDATDNKWISRGPNNVGGRVRALMFDPNDSTDETVFAGGVSGGLWRNTNISNADSEWTRVNIDENLNVSSIIADPNNSNVFYLGTGESYVGGDVNGDGLWKSTDAGLTWAKVFGGITGATTFETLSNITVNSPSSISGSYESVPTTAFGSEITSTITAEAVLANDSGGVSTEGCSSFGGSAVGKIAIIRRGSCNFTTKVKHAQDQGALAVVVMNNIKGAPIVMGGSDNTITIPAVMISKSDGDKIESALSLGSVNISLHPATGTFSGALVPGIQHINDIQIRNNGGVSEIYVAAGDSFYRPASLPTYLSGPHFGLYKSIDGGATWVEMNLPLTANNNKPCPNDIEIGVDGKIWVSTINSVFYGDGGGRVYSSSDGINFTLAYELAGVSRTQIDVSSTNANKIYVLGDVSAGGVVIRRTNDGFSSPFSTTNLALPDDSDPNISANDFTRGQAFYDLMLEIDPSNDNNVFVGGIDIFKSTDQGSAWTQLSHWYGGFSHQYVHADQHSAAFGNNNSSKLIFGNDGGVFYSNDGGTTIVERNKGFITSQFYTIAVAPSTIFTGDYFAGGLQDNGTQLFENANTTGPSSSTLAMGGDGAYTFFDQDGSDRYYIANYVYNAAITLFNYDGSDVTISDESESNGSFINPGALDSNQDILYTNYSSSANGNAIRRYSGIKSRFTLQATTLTNPVLDSRPTAFKVSPYSTTSSTVYVGTVLGDIIKITNANVDGSEQVWTEIEPNDDIIGSISDIELGTNENEIYVSVHNYGVKSVWYTDDGGTTWVSKEGNLPDMPVKAILPNPLNSEEVIIGTELGVWFTNDFSSTNPTWNTSFNGMSNVKVTDLDVRDDNVVFASTYGRGVFSGNFTATPLSVNAIENSLEQQVTVFPTISEGLVSFKPKRSLGETQLQIFTTSGQKVYETALNFHKAQQYEINLELSSGLYLIQLNTSSHTEHHRIIIN